MKQLPLPDDPERLPHDPSPEQIRKMCAAFRLKWDAKRLALNELATGSVEVVEADYRGERRPRRGVE